MGNERLISALMERKGRVIGKEIRFLCAVHDESHPSCYYNTEKRAWHCQSCGGSGGEKALCEALGLDWEPDPSLGANRHERPPELPPGVTGAMSDGFRLTRLHTYRGVDGIVLGYAARYDHGSAKKVIPYFEFGKLRSGDGWLMKAPKAPRPIYGLDLVASRTDERVWVVEGEKCADALRELGLLAVTSQGGSKAAGKTDWSPLAGRNVTIWPDNDEPGKTYLDDVKKELRKQKSRVDVIDIVAAGCTGRGSDCVDWIADHRRATREDVESLARLDGKTRVAVGGVDIDADWAAGLEVDKMGRPKSTEVNIRKILRSHPDWRAAYRWNARSLSVAIERDLPIEIKRGEVFRDCHYDAIAEWLHDVCGIENPPALRSGAAFIALAQEREFDPVADWLKSLQWDGTSRLDEWLPSVSGCESNEYSRAVGRAFCVAAVARALRPGAKVDTVLVLQGEQGVRKSTMLAELAVRPEWFTDHVAEIGEKDAALQIAGPWIIEFSELDAITGKRENERVKSWLTQQRDRFRPPFGRTVIDIPRRCVFTGTSNQAFFLRDETGGRRYWPIMVGKIDINTLRAQREQIWAEAVMAFSRGDKWWFEGEIQEAAKEVQEAHREADPWEEEIVAWLEETRFSAKSDPWRSTNGSRLWTTSREVMRDGLKIPVDRQTKRELDRVGKALTRFGWTRAKRRVENSVMSVWYPPEREGIERVVEMVRVEQEQTRFGGVDW